MTPRLTFCAIAVFWLTMNGLLWRAEFGSRGGDTDVPAILVWRKVLTAPDSSSLSVYQKGDRMGYCEIATSIGQQMASVDADKPPPESLARQAGYQIHFAGNVSFGDFTNRLKFDGTVKFATPRQWRELKLRITSRLAAVDIYSQATNQTIHFRISNEGVVLERDLTFADLHNPASIMRAFLGDFGGGFFNFIELPELPSAGVQNMEWQAIRTRMKVGSETLPVYQVEAFAMGYKIRVFISTLGEVLRVELPGDIVARIDQ